MTHLEHSIHRFACAVGWLTYAICIGLIAILAPQGLDDANECTDTEGQQ